MPGKRSQAFLDVAIAEPGDLLAVLENLDRTGICQPV
jgi:hypothetical protein